eukprot:3046476-Pleurochrysis_carterae.AAC.1
MTWAEAEVRASGVGAGALQWGGSACATVTHTRQCHAPSSAWGRTEKRHDSLGALAPPSPSYPCSRDGRGRVRASG